MSSLSNLCDSLSSAVNKPAMIVSSGIRMDLSDEQLKKAVWSMSVIESRLMDSREEQVSKAQCLIVVVELGRLMELEFREVQE